MMKVKLVEILSLPNYLTEDIFDINSIDPDDLEILKIARDAKDINTIASKYIDKQYEKLLGPIIRSIIYYRSVDKNVNDFLKVLDVTGPKVNLDDAFIIFNAISKIDNVDKILKYFQPSYQLLASTDIGYMINLLSILSDDRQRKKYKKDGKEPSIEKDVLQGQDSFLPNTNTIKKRMDAFISDSSDDEISLAQLFKNKKVPNDEVLSLLLSFIQNDQVPDELKNADKKQQFIAYIEDIFTKGNEKKQNDLLKYTYVDQNVSYGTPKGNSEIISAIYTRSDDSNSYSSSKSIREILERKNIKTPTKIIQYLNNIIKNNKSIYNQDKTSASFKLRQLLTSKNNTLFNQMLDQQIVTSVEGKTDKEKDDILSDKIVKKVLKFLETAIKQNYLYTTIQEALAINGKQPAEGYAVLGHYLTNMKSDAKSGYIDKFNKVWKNENLQKQLLNAKITRSGKGFNWLKAVVDFLNNIK